jgi:hypothetical protein
MLLATPALRSFIPDSQGDNADGVGNSRAVVPVNFTTY